MKSLGVKYAASADSVVDCREGSDECRVKALAAALGVIAIDRAVAVGGAGGVKTDALADSALVQPLVLAGSVDGGGPTSMWRKASARLRTARVVGDARAPSIGAPRKRMSMIEHGVGGGRGTCVGGSGVGGAPLMGARGDDSDAALRPPPLGVAGGVVPHSASRRMSSKRTGPSPRAAGDDPPVACCCGEGNDGEGEGG